MTKQPKKIYHAHLVPYGPEDNGYRVGSECYEADAESLHGYVNSILLEMNDAGGGLWYAVKPEEITLYGEIDPAHYVLCGEYPGELPIMVAMYAKDEPEETDSE